MGLFSKTEFNSFDDLFHQQIEDLYDAEQRLVQALPKMIDAAQDGQLKEALQNDLQQTQGHVSRLEQVFAQLGQEPERETCAAMQGLIKEAEEMADARGEKEVRDAALIAAAQRIEHYEIAGYGTARNFAQRLGKEQAAQALQETLDEEKAGDAKLSALAKSSVNVQAAQA